MGKITGQAITESETEEDYLVIEHLENIEPESGSIAEDEKIITGTFQDVCIDSCFIEMLLKENIAYQLLLYVEEGTILNIDEMSYTIRKD
jgi:hypothetical protein